MEILLQSLYDAFLKIVYIAKIIVPLMIVLEIFEEYGLLKAVEKLFSKFTRTLGISEKSSYPLSVGLIVGLSYGAGVLIDRTSRGELDDRSIFIMTMFLILCHAIVEDTLLFVALGANPLILIGTRFLVAFIFAYVLSKKTK